MSNNEKKVLLNEDELKEVSGGLASNVIPPTICETLKSEEECLAAKVCNWTNGMCTGTPNVR